MATTKTDPKLSSQRKKSQTYEGFTREQLIEAYRIMYTSRASTTGKSCLSASRRFFFQMSGAGHEAIGVAAGMAPEAGLRLVLSLLSRPRCCAPALGAKPLDMFLQAVGAADDPSSGGRQMPSTGDTRLLNIVINHRPRDRRDPAGRNAPRPDAIFHSAPLRS